MKTHHKGINLKSKFGNAIRLSSAIVGCFPQRTPLSDAQVRDFSPTSRVSDY